MPQLKKTFSLLTPVLIVCQAFASIVGQTPNPIQNSAHSVNRAYTATENQSGAREFRFIVTSKAATMEKELNDFAAQGFRLERVSKSSYGDDIAALVVRDKSTPETTATSAETVDTKSNHARYEYKLLATRKASTLEKEISEAAADGFEFRGLTSVIRLVPYSLGDETIAVMERPIGVSAPRYEYKMLSTKREATTQKELDEAVAKGFTPQFVLRGQDNGAASLLFGPNFVITIILGKEANGTAREDSREYKFLTTTKVSTMEKEMNRAAKQGYRFYMAASDLLMLMSRERAVKTASDFEYKLLATRKTSTMQQELSEHAAQGYSFLATSRGLGGLTSVLERDAQQPNAQATQRKRHAYKLLAALREKTTQNEIAESVAAGYRILDLTTIGEFVLVLDRQDGDLQITTGRN